MADKDILILDEPSTGLDPLMRLTFVDILKEEQKKGKTIFMSSQMFDELEETCDRVALIFEGRIVDIADVNALKNLPYKMFKVEFLEDAEYKKFKAGEFKVVRDQPQYSQVTVQVFNEDLKQFFSTLKNYKLKFISEVNYNLEKYFLEKLKEMQKEAKNV